ncbi:MAG: hypothetical protein GXP42_00595 [Chloroflexi bacterium]|nr:hypothetical protein [Chloroflexota bacterium]
MSGIFGFFDKDGATVDPALLETMRRAMAYWGPDGGGVWRRGPCGLGHLLLYNTPQALHERMPRSVAHGQLAITAEARLDNRDELCDYFGIARNQRERIPDGDLILLAYDRWGEDCLNHLFGDWSFAVWRPDERRLFLARDHHGVTALYYINRQHFFAFASSQKALLSLPQVAPQLNQRKFTAALAHWEDDPVETFFKDVHLLPPAHALTVTPEKMASSRYWQLENAPEVRLPSADAYAKALREMLERVVRSQVRSFRGVGLSLSGGLDSAGLAALAAPMLAEQNKPLFTYTATPMSDDAVTVGTRVADESRWARAVTVHVGNIRDHYPHFAEISPIVAVQIMLDILDAPTMGWANAPWLLGIRELAAQQGVGALLNGYMGNVSASWRGLLRSQDWLTLLRQGRWKEGLRAKAAPHIPYALARRIKRDRLAHDDWRTHSVIHSQAARRHHLAQRMADANREIDDKMLQHGRLSSREQRLATIKPGQWTGGARQAALAAWFGLETRIPLADARLMTFCLGIPDRFFYVNGESRGLYRQALGDILPEEVRTNHRRGLQGADLLARLRMHREDVEWAFSRIRDDPLVTAYIDIPRLNAIWADISQSEAIDHPRWVAARLLMHGLACSLFLIRFSKGGDLWTLDSDESTTRQPQLSPHTHLNGSAS